MNYLKVKLKAPTEASILTDIKGLSWKGEAVYPIYPEDYEKSFGPFERFVVTPPRQEVATPGEYDENGNEVSPPVFGDWFCYLVLPQGYDTSTLSTLIPD